MPMQNANNFRQHSNTDGITFYGPDSCMQLGYYDLYLSVKMYPIKPEAERNERSVYDYTNRINCSISREDVLYIAKALEDVMIPKSKAGEACFLGIRVTKNNTLFCISNGIGETGKLDPYVAIYKNLDKNFRPAERRTFRFGPKKVIVKYNPDASDIAVLEDNSAGLLMLQKFFDQCTALCAADIHVMKYINRFKTNSQFNIMNSIAGKLGIPIHSVNTVDRRNAPDWDNASAAVADEDIEMEALPEASDNFGAPSDLSELQSLI